MPGDSRPTRLSTRRINLCLQLTAAVLAAAAVVSLVAGLMMPVETAAIATPASRPVQANAGMASSVTFESLGPVFSRSFRAPVPTTEAAATAAAENAPAAKPPTPPPEPVTPVAALTLVGTIGDSLALIRGPDGSVVIVEPNDNLEGTAILAIRPSQVDVRQNGKNSTLRKLPPPDDRGLISEPSSQPS
jgi:hypothetical protein